MLTAVRCNPGRGAGRGVRRQLRGGGSAGIDFALLSRRSFPARRAQAPLQLNIEYAPAAIDSSGRPDAARRTDVGDVPGALAKLLPDQLEGAKAAAANVRSGGQIRAAAIRDRQGAARLTSPPCDDARRRWQGAEPSIPVNCRVPPQSSVSPGSFAGTVVVTFTYEARDRHRAKGTKRLISSTSVSVAGLEAGRPPPLLILLRLPACASQGACPLSGGHRGKAGRRQ